jgi:hypothetical protein
MKILKVASHLVLVALVLFLSASVGKSQVEGYKGTFTLPCEVRWGSVTLPAGDYTLRMDSVSAPRFIYLKGEGKSAVVLAGVPNPRGSSNHSELVLVETAHGYAVRSLSVGEVGLSLDYAVSQRQTVYASNREHPGSIGVAVRSGH